MEALECLADVAAAIRSPASLRKLPGFAHVKFDKPSERDEHIIHLNEGHSKSLELLPGESGHYVNAAPNPAEEAWRVPACAALGNQHPCQGSKHEVGLQTLDGNKNANGASPPNFLVGSFASGVVGQDGGSVQPPSNSAADTDPSAHVGFAPVPYQSGLLTPSDRLLAQLLVFIAEQNLKTYYEHLCSFFETAWLRSELDKAILWLCAQKLVECSGDPVELVLCPKAVTAIDALKKALIEDTKAREELLRNLEQKTISNKNHQTDIGSQRMHPSDCEVAIRVSMRKAGKRKVENAENAKNKVKTKFPEGKKGKDGPSKASQATNKIRAGRLTAWIKRNRPKGLLTRALRARAQVLVFVALHTTVGDMEIRKKYGNNPDISKAIRWLYGEGYLSRSGGGKKSDPYRWTLLPKGLEHVPSLKQKLLADTLAREEMEQLLPQEFKSDLD